MVVGGGGGGGGGVGVIPQRELSSMQCNILVAISKLYSTKNWKTALMAKQNSPVG